MRKRLPTKEEFLKKIPPINEKNWDQELFVCPICGSGVKRDLSVLYCVLPPKYKYFCSNKDCEYKDIF